MSTNRAGGLPATTASRGGELSGPWACGFWLLLPIPLVSKSNFRRGRNTHWRTYRGFEEQVAVEMRNHLPADWLRDQADTPFAGRPRYASVIAARSAVDAGNYSKSVLDACEGVVFTNDAQVQVTTALSERGRRDPYLMIAFAQLKPGCSSQEAARAGSALLTACSEILEQLR